MIYSPRFSRGAVGCLLLSSLPSIAFFSVHVFRASRGGTLSGSGGFLSCPAFCHSDAVTAFELAPYAGRVDRRAVVTFPGCVFFPCLSRSRAVVGGRSRWRVVQVRSCAWGMVRGVTPMLGYCRKSSCGAARPCGRAGWCGCVGGAFTAWRRAVCPRLGLLACDRVKVGGEVSRSASPSVSYFNLTPKSYKKIKILIYFKKPHKCGKIVIFFNLIRGIF